MATFLVSLLKDETSASLFTISIAILVSAGLYFLTLRRKQRAPLPPGPTGLPLVGYLPFLGTHLHREFTALAATYGPIYSLRLGRKLCMVVSSSSLVKEIVRDQDAIFANRDPPISAVVLTYGGDDVAFSNYGPLWKKLRKVFVREMLGGANLEECYGLRKQQVRSSVKEVHKRCSGGEAMDFGEMAFKTTTNAMLSMLWGGVAGDDEGFYGEFRELESEMLVLMGTPNVSDFIPALARFDLQGIEKKSKKLLDKFDEILSSVIEERLRAVEKRGGNGRKDFLQVLLDLNRNGGSDGESYVTTNQVKALLMDILVGGTDTTSTMLEWTMAQLVKHPDAMSKVYKELNEIVGQSGRRVCPGQPLAVNTLKYVLATLLHSFDWKLPAGTELELEDKFGIVIKKMNPLVLVPTPRLLNLELY
ncbi:unnamed protein product [Linum tenue]|uniref:Cytochrome P450 n=1 Tax=Linum tenue TaxID=586396 RepID=A0AAV0JUK3_9ROSI|nr:unnamed protein product [Linum tenue]